MITPSCRNFTNVHFLALMIMTLLGFYMCFREIRRVNAEVAWQRSVVHMLENQILASQSACSAGGSGSGSGSGSGNGSGSGSGSGGSGSSAGSGCEYNDGDDDYNGDNGYDDNDEDDDVSDFGLSQLLGIALQQLQPNSSVATGAAAGGASGTVVVEDVTEEGPAATAAPATEPEAASAASAAATEPAEPTASSAAAAEEPAAASAAEPPVDLEAMDVASLKALCGKLGVALKPACRKANIIQAILEKTKGAP